MSERNDTERRRSRLRAALIGGWVADAASLGLHWLYDSNRIREVAGDSPEFLPPKRDYFEGGFGYFAHDGKRAGDLSHYGAATDVITESLVANEGRLAIRDYQRRFRLYFGPGGGWQGYIDNPTRITLRHLDAAEETAIADARARTLTGLTDEQQRVLVQKVRPYTRRLSGDALDQPIRSAIALTYPDPKVQEAGVSLAHSIDNQLVRESGADDMQLPAVSKLPPLIACYLDAPDRTRIVEAAVRVTNHNAQAVAWAHFATALLSGLFAGSDLSGALDAATDTAPDPDSISRARNMTPLDPAAAGDAFGRTCYLNEAMPVVAHILAHSQSFREAIRANCYSGGDSCGRAWILGPAAAALYGVGGERGVPLSWLARLNEGVRIIERIEHLISDTAPVDDTGGRSRNQA